MKLYKSISSALKEREQVKAIKISVKGKDFPEELFNLSSLEEAYIEGDCESLPSSFVGWRKLKVLSIKWNSFKGDLSPFFSIPLLENLKIIETPLLNLLLPLGKIVAPIKVLTIKSCQLSKLPEEISMLTQLSELYLPGNELSELPFSFRELHQLKRLNLDNNQFNKFPDSIKNMKKLSHLSIDGNLFSEEEKERIQREFHLTIN